MFLIEFMNVMKKIKVFHVKYQSNDNSVQFFCKTYVRSSSVNMIFLTAIYVEHGKNIHHNFFNTLQIYKSYIATNNESFDKVCLRK